MYIFSIIEGKIELCSHLVHCIVRRQCTSNRFGLVPFQLSICRNYYFRWWSQSSPTRNLRPGLNLDGFYRLVFTRVTGSVGLFFFLFFWFCCLLHQPRPRQYHFRCLTRNILLGFWYYITKKKKTRVRRDERNTYTYTIIVSFPLWIENWDFLLLFFFTICILFANPWYLHR